MIVIVTLDLVVGYLMAWTSKGSHSVSQHWFGVCARACVCVWDYL